MSNNTHLYDISDEILDVLRPDSDEMINEKELDLLFLKFDDKAKACLAVLKNLKGVLKMVTEERKRLQGKEYTLEKKIENLEIYVMSEMLRVERPTIDYGTHKAIIADSPLSVDINMSILPDKWHKPVEPEDPKPDKQALIEHHRNTEEEIPGATFKRGRHLRVTK